MRQQGHEFGPFLASPRQREEILDGHVLVSRISTFVCFSTVTVAFASQQAPSFHQKIRNALVSQVADPRLSLNLRNFSGALRLTSYIAYGLHPQRA